MDIRKQSARLKKQAARMTQTHPWRKNALLQQQKLIDHNVNTEKQQWNTTLLLTQRKMQSSIKQLQKERVMLWQRQTSSGWHIRYVIPFEFHVHFYGLTSRLWAFVAYRRRPRWHQMSAIEHISLFRIFEVYFILYLFIYFLHPSCPNTRNATTMTSTGIAIMPPW